MLWCGHSPVTALSRSWQAGVCWGILAGGVELAGVLMFASVLVVSYDE